jgi:hypothetical protein
MNSNTAFPRLMARSYLSRSQPRTYKMATPTNTAVAAKKMMSSMSTFLRSGNLELNKYRHVQAVLSLAKIREPGIRN